MISQTLLGPRPPDDFQGNGCGALGTGFFDWALKRLRFDMSECCRWHDWCYEQLREGDADYSRLQADVWFHDNIRLAGQWQKKKIRGWIIRAIAYKLVRRGGWFATRPEENDNG